MIPRLKPWLGWNELFSALSPGGPQDVQRFENAFAETVGQRHAVAFPYGRTGLIVLLEALGLTDREVICPAYTCVVVPHAICVSGNRPVFVDSETIGFNMDLALVDQALSRDTGALVATSLFGHPVDIDRLDRLASANPGMAVIQDCAHSFVASWRGRPVNREGDAAIFGLNISKLATSIFGGMVTTDDPRLAARLREVRAQRVKPASRTKSFRRLAYLLAVSPAFQENVYGMVNRFERSGLLDRFVRYYDESKIDMPPDFLESLTPLEARTGISQLARYPMIIARRRANARYYLDHLPKRHDTILPEWEGGATWSHFVIRTPKREQIISDGLTNGVQFGRLIEYSIPRMASYRSMRFIDIGVADRLAKEALNLPIHCDSRGTLARVLAVYKTSNQN